MAIFQLSEENSQVPPLSRHLCFLRPCERSRLLPRTNPEASSAFSLGLFTYPRSVLLQLFLPPLFIANLNPFKPLPSFFPKLDPRRSTINPRTAVPRPFLSSHLLRCPHHAPRPVLVRLLAMNGLCLLNVTILIDRVGLVLTLYIVKLL